MTLQAETGKLGEDIACEFLRENGFKILFRNARTKFGELDIVAKDRDGTLAFVEVKTTLSRGNIEDPRFGNTKSGQHGNNSAIAELLPEDQMSSSKMHKFKRIAEFFANEHKNLISDEAGWRLDFIGVIFDDVGKQTMRHYKNIS